VQVARFAAGAAVLTAGILFSGCSHGGTTPALQSTESLAQSVSGSFDYSTRPKLRFIGPSLNFSNCVPTNTTDCAQPTVLRTGYNFPSNDTGTGKTIMIVDAFGSPTIATDLKKFSSDNALPLPTAQNFVIYYPGGKPSFNPNQAADVRWAEETSLDVEWAHAAAPGAKIALIISANDQGTSIQSAQQFAIETVKGDVLSLSFGVQEASINGGANNTQLQQAHQVYQQAKANNITVIASAGDLGALGGFTSANSEFPASDPYVLGVGGTNLTLFHNNSYRNESVWNDADNCLSPCAFGADGATGGAPSSIFPIPAWQQKAITAYNSATGAAILNRSSADVAYDASPASGVAIYIGFGTQVTSLGVNGYYAVGGTSQGTPQWAGIIAAADQALGKDLGCVNATFYALSNSTKNPPFHDITAGDNKFPLGQFGYVATAGWDPPTGLGSPDVSNLISALAAAAYVPCP
jgi:subtilase family serine protease